MNMISRFVLVFTITSLFLAASALAKPDLFISAPDSATSRLIKKMIDEPFVKQARLVRVDLDPIERNDQVMVLNLLEDLSLLAVRERVTTRPDGYSWFGHLSRIKHSRVILTVTEGDLAGNITFPGTMIQIRPAGNGLHLIREIDQSLFNDGPGPLFAQPPKNYTPPPSNLSTSDDGSIIDLVVFYTTAVASASGNIYAEILLAIDETNDSYQNSGINQRVRLVHAQETDYVETGDISLDLQNFKHAGNGYLEEVHAVRDSHCADLSSLWVETADACGVTWQMDTVAHWFADYAFSVVKRSCATGYYSFGHEMGHNMGARHDWYVDDGVTPYVYAHGYVNTDDQWRTIMSYNQACSDLGFDCTRLQYWSNPEVGYGGDPMGVPDGPPEYLPADNRLTLNLTAPTVALFRDSAECTVTSECPVGSLCLTAYLYGSWDGQQHACENEITVDLYNPSLAPVYQGLSATLDFAGEAIVDLVGPAVVADSYYVVLRHAGHIDLLTQDPVYFDPGQGQDIDFSDPANVSCGQSTLYDDGGFWTMPAGDSDSDQKVSLADFQYLVQNWSGGNPICDYDCDGYCRLGDFNILRHTWNTQGCAP